MPDTEAMTARLKPTRHAPIEMKRHFSKPGVSPYGEIEWDHRTAEIKDYRTGEVTFRQERVRVPASWSQRATDIVAQKYLYGDQSKGFCPTLGGREAGIDNLVSRVANTIAYWARQDGYLSDTDSYVFRDELTTLLLGQYAAFNSPVWFNVGLSHAYDLKGGPNGYRWDPVAGETVPVTDAYEYPQGSACFIVSIEDTMESIFDRAKTEALLFKYGSGTGSDNSVLRSSREKVTGGGKPSGPVTFMKVYDAVAGTVKSGGKTRRAAKMETLKCVHPDILDFIRAKGIEEGKARILVEHGLSCDLDGPAYSTVAFQNANLSVRVTDDFLRKAEAGEKFDTIAVTTGDVVDSLDASEVLTAICDGTWVCGDPGLQYEDTIQDWHTCPNTAPINSSNPCSEYMFIDDSACNLSSINLLKFRRDDGTFNVDGFRAACRIMILAQELIVGRASYPTAKIAENSYKYRPLGLGYANLGALIMSYGLPYDSEDGRSMAGAFTAIMHGEAYLQSARIADRMGPFEGWDLNREPMDRVIAKHRLACEDKAYATFDDLEIDDPLYQVWLAAMDTWDDLSNHGAPNGYRNSQVTVLAPTGTIAFMMDCDTTGVEPDIALVKYKKLAGGGSLKIINRTVPLALKTLGYDQTEIDGILSYIDANDTIEGAPGLLESHLPVFDCSFPPKGGGRSIHYRGHIAMMAAVQPFLSGAISKTVNLPNDATVDDIRRTYLEGWKLGLKAIAIYRDGSKASQPVSTSSGKAKTEAPAVKPLDLKIDPEWLLKAADMEDAVGGISIGTFPPLVLPFPEPIRRRLPNTRQSLTHKFVINGHEGYITVGLHPDGTPGEVFLTMAKEGSTISGLMDTIGTQTSLLLQYGVPLQVMVDKFKHVSFEPSGFTQNPMIPIAKSVVDYVFRFLEETFIHSTPAPTPIPVVASATRGEPTRNDTSPTTTGASCRNCGGLTQITGRCSTCTNCGETSGCG